MMFMIASPRWVTAYAFNELVARQSPDEVLSFLWMWLKAEKLRKPRLDHVVFWSDGCYGQCWNQYVVAVVVGVVAVASSR